MAICTRLIPAIEIDDIHDVIIITDSFTIVRKILESKVDLLQNIFIPLASAIKSFLSKDGRNKFTSGTALAKLNNLDINLLMTKLRQTHVPLHFPARTHTYSAKRKNTMTSSTNSKHCLLTASRKNTTSLTSKTKSKESSSPHTPKEACGSLLQGSPIHYVLVSPI